MDLVKPASSEKNDIIIIISKTIWNNMEFEISNPVESGSNGFPENCTQSKKLLW